MSTVIYITDYTLFQVFVTNHDKSIFIFEICIIILFNAD